MPFLTRILTALALGSLMTTAVAQATDVSPTITVGTQEVGLTVGYMIPHRLTIEHKTNQQGPVFMPTWLMTITDPVGNGWYRGQVSIGTEVVYIQFNEPVLTHGIGFTPKIKYTFVALDNIRPYVEFAGGPFWTDLAGEAPEESVEFNFVLSAGFGVSWFITPQTALNVGYRFQHISNAGIQISEYKAEREPAVRRVLMLFLRRGSP